MQSTSSKGWQVSQPRSRSIHERVGNDYRWLVAQFALLSLLAAGAPAGRWVVGRLPAPWPSIVDALAGVAIMLAGLLIANQARRDLGDSLRIAPSPLDDAALVERGWYGRVRHPLYLAVILGAVGWAVLWLNLIGFALAVVLALFLLLKSRHEERLLIATYEGYTGYMKRVHSRFVPKIW